MFGFPGLAGCRHTGSYPAGVWGVHPFWKSYTFSCNSRLTFPGPIVRISPTELHIDEPDYYEELFSQHKPRNKSLFYLNQFDLPGSGFGTEDHKLHRLRRAAINPFLSKRSVERLHPMLTFMIEKLCNRIEEFRESGQPMSMRQVYMCLTTDVVTLYTLNHSWNHLDSPDFSPMWVETIKATAASGHVMKQLPFIFPIIRALPRKLVSAMNPGMLLLLEFQDVCSHPFPNKITGLAELHARGSRKTRKMSSTAFINPTQNTKILASTRPSFTLL